MSDAQERKLNQAAYRGMREGIERDYPVGRFIAIIRGQIVADADGFEALRTILQANGHDPAQVLIVQAGTNYPDAATILMQVTQQ